MFFFPFLLVGLAGSFIDSVTTRLLDPHEFVGFALGFGSLLVSFLHNPWRWRDLCFGAVALSASACVDAAVADVFLDALSWSSVAMIFTSLVASVVCLLFCVWWIPDRYGFDLMVISTGFNSWPTAPRRTSDAIIHQLVYFCSAAFLEVGVHEVMLSAHWMWSALTGVLCLLLLAYALRISPLSLILYTVASSGFDVAWSASLWTLSRRNVWIQFYVGNAVGLFFLFLLFGTAYVISPRGHYWKSTRDD